MRKVNRFYFCMKAEDVVRRSARSFDYKSGFLPFGSTSGFFGSFAYTTTS